jgi:hypothetical protein
MMGQIERGTEPDKFHKGPKVNGSPQFTAEAQRTPRLRREELENLALPLSAFPRRSPRLCGELRTVIQLMKFDANLIISPSLCACDSVAINKYGRID